MQIIDHINSSGHYGKTLNELIREKEIEKLKILQEDLETMEKDFYNKIGIKDYL